MQLGEQRHESKDKRLTELARLVMGTIFLVVKLLLHTGLKVTEVAHDIQVQVARYVHDMGFINYYISHMVW